jgi:hypothetical protein
MDMVHIVPLGGPDRSTPLGGFGSDPTIHLDSLIKRSAGFTALGRSNRLPPRLPELFGGTLAPDRAAPRGADREAIHENINRIGVKLGEVAQRHPATPFDGQPECYVMNPVVRRYRLVRHRLPINYQLDETGFARWGELPLAPGTAQVDCVAKESPTAWRNHAAVGYRERRARGKRHLRADFDHSRLLQPELLAGPLAPHGEFQRVGEAVRDGTNVLRSGPRTRRRS